MAESAEKQSALWVVSEGRGLPAVLGALETLVLSCEAIV